MCNANRKKRFEVRTKLILGKVRYDEISRTYNQFQGSWYRNKVEVTSFIALLSSMSSFCKIPNFLLPPRKHKFGMGFIPNTTQTRGRTNLKELRNRAARAQNNYIYTYIYIYVYIQLCSFISCS